MNSFSDMSTSKDLSSSSEEILEQWIKPGSELIKTTRLVHDEDLNGVTSFLVQNVLDKSLLKMECIRSGSEIGSVGSDDLASLSEDSLDDDKKCCPLSEDSLGDDKKCCPLSAELIEDMNETNFFESCQHSLNEFKYGHSTHSQNESFRRFASLENTLKELRREHSEELLQNYCPTVATTGERKEIEETLHCKAFGNTEVHMLQNHHGLLGGYLDKFQQRNFQPLKISHSESSFFDETFSRRNNPFFKPASFASKICRSGFNRFMIEVDDLCCKKEADVYNRIMAILQENVFCLVNTENYMENVATRLRPGPSAGPSRGGPYTGPSIGPSSAGPSTCPSIGPSSAGPSTVPYTGPSIGPSAGPSTGPSIGPSSAGPSTGPYTGPSIGPPAGPYTGPYTGPSIGPSSAGPSTGPYTGPSIGPSAGPSTDPSVEASNRATTHITAFKGQAQMENVVNSLSNELKENYRLVKYSSASAYQAGYETAAAHTNVLKEELYKKEMILNHFREENIRMAQSMVEKEQNWSQTKTRLYSEIARLTREAVAPGKTQIPVNKYGMVTLPWKRLNVLFEKYYNEEKMFSLVLDKEQKINELKLMVYQQRMMNRELQEKLLSSYYSPHLLDQPSESTVREDFNEKMDLYRVSNYLDISDGSSLPYVSSNPDEAFMDIFNIKGEDYYSCRPESFSNHSLVSHSQTDSSQSFSTDQMQDIIAQIRGYMLN